jgi:hypothetical protein
MHSERMKPWTFLAQKWINYDCIYFKWIIP